MAGVVLSESDLSRKAAANSLPLQDAFAVLFFVSVGMLFEPSILITQPLMVAVVLLLILLGKSLAAFAIVLLLGFPLSGRSRSADVIALNFCKLLTLSQRDFRELLCRSPGLRDPVAEVAKERGDTNRQFRERPHGGVALPT